MAQSDEIDLLDIAVKLNRVFIKNLKSLIAAFVIGTLAGLAVYQFVPKVYESKMIFSSDVLTFSIGKALVTDLEKLVKEKNHDELAKKFAIASNEIRSITGISIENSTEKREGIKEEKEKAILIISLNGTDPSLFSKLQPSLIKFFESNEYSLIREKEKKALYQGMIDETLREIDELEKLRSRFLEGNLFKNSNANTILFDPTTINSRIVDLTYEKLKNQNELAVVNSIQLIQGFTNFNNPISPKLSISLASGASLGLFFVIALIAIKGFRQMISLANEKQDK
jgi:hypothetical protein